MVKNLLADKQILARILKYTLEEFTDMELNDIKKCISSDVEDGSIEKIEMQPSVLYGKETGMLSVDLMEGYLISLRVKDDAKKSKNKLISMLEDLLNRDSLAEKKNKLVKKHHLVMDVELEGRLSKMCNLSERIEENTMERVASEMIVKGSSDEDIVEITELPLARIVELREMEACCV